MFDSKLKNAFQKGLRLPQETHVETLEFAKSAGWDSISHLQLIGAIEEEFGILVETKDMLDMSSYIKAKEIVGRYVH